MSCYYFITGCILCGIGGYSQTLLFTEIMYDPPASCPEYLEITNTGMDSAVLDGMWIQKNAGKPVEIEVPSAWNSAESRVFTRDKEGFYACYDEVDTTLVYKADLFALTNTGASILLSGKYPSDQNIDQIKYSPNDQNELFTNSKGIALERDLREPSGNKWRSGFVQFGYRSPGFLPVWQETSDVTITFSTSAVYLQGGREPSSLEIEIDSDDVDGSVTIEVYDLSGQKVQTIANAVPLQGGEVFIWKGRTKSGEFFSEGLYLFWIYYFDVNGQKRIFKKTCVLSNI